MKRLVLLALLLPATASAQQWGRGLVPGDSVRARTSTIMVYGRFAQWSDSTLGMVDTTLMRQSVLGFEMWRKRDAGRTFAEAFAIGVGIGLADYLLTDSENRRGRAGISITLGALTAVLGYGASMIFQPGKWITP